MEINHYLHAEFLRPQTFLEDVFLAVPSFLGIHPDSESQRVESQRLHQSGTIHLHTGCGIEFIAFAFHFRVPADIGTLRECRFRGLSA